MARTELRKRLLSLVLDKKTFVLKCECCGEELENTDPSNLIEAAIECGWEPSKDGRVVVCDECLEG